MAEQKKRGRTAGFRMPEEHRTKISNSKILNRLIDFAEGKKGVDMSSTQVTAALGLLDRVMPKLSSTTLEGTGEGGTILFKTVYEAKPEDR